MEKNMLKHINRERIKFVFSTITLIFVANLRRDIPDFTEKSGIVFRILINEI